MIYHSFAQFYDQLMYDFDYLKVNNFIESYAKANNKNFKNILDLACGTGNLTELLLDKNRKITAVDLSEDMLSVAENKLRNSRVRFFKMDMKYFILNEKFDLIVSICDSFNYLLSKEDLENVLKNSYNHLEDSGVLIFDLNTQAKFKSFPPIYIDETEDVFYTWENFYDDSDMVNTYFINFFVKENGEFYKRFYEEHYERAYKNEEVIKTLKNIGFKNIQTYDNYNFKKDLDDSHRIVYIAEK